jgi:hypothetical protein
MRGTRLQKIHLVKMNRLPLEKRAQMLEMLCEGMRALL